MIHARRGCCRLLQISTRKTRFAAHTTKSAGLADADLLYTTDIYEEYAKNIEKRSVVKAMCLHIAHDCNLRCKYCFADTGSFHHDRSMMSAEVGKKAIDFVIQNSGKRKNIEIDYFGGEPLMNFGVVKEITEYAKGAGRKTRKKLSLYDYDERAAARRGEKGVHKRKHVQHCAQH